MKPGIVAYIRDKTISYLGFVGQEFLLEKYLEPPVTEDRDQLATGHQNPL
jgi:hypothetical protein